MIDEPLITIAIPTFDRLEYLKQSVASALAQTYRNVEVLIGDDGPTRDIEGWVKGMIAADSRIRYQRNERNLGLAGNWNALADSARGEFIVIIGDDDRLLPTFVENLVELIQGASVAFSNHFLIDTDGRRLDQESTVWTSRYQRNRLPAGFVADAAACVWQNSVPMSASLLRTRDVQRLRFKEDLNTPEIEFLARLANEGAQFVFTPGITWLSTERIRHRRRQTACAAKRWPGGFATSPYPRTSNRLSANSWPRCWSMLLVAVLNAEIVKQRMSS